MKRYGNIYEKIYDMDNLRLAHKHARNGKSQYTEVKYVDSHTEECLEKIHESLKNKTYKTSPYKIKTIFDGNKERIIYKLPYYPDRIVQWALMQQIEDILLKTFTNNTHASIPNHGMKGAYKQIEKYLKENPQDSKYCLQMDIRKYFPHINHKILKNMFLRKFKDENLLWLINDIIDSMTDGIGVPIGNYTSQYFANFYLSKFVHWLKETKHVKFVDVYMDDIIILSGDKAYLHQLHLDCEKYLKEKLELDIKDNWQVYPVDIRGVDFVGYKFYHNHIALRKSTKLRMERKMNYYKKFYNKFHYLDHSAYCSINSYAGFLLFGNCKHLHKKYIIDNGFDYLVKRKDGNYIIKKEKRG